MPLLFLHGVNVRRGDTPEAQKVYDNKVALVSQQFGATAFADRVTAPDGLRVFSPYWGDLGIKFARNLKSVPHGGLESLAVGVPPDSQQLVQATAARLDADVLAEPGLATAPLVTMAKTRNLGAAVDLLFAGVNNAPVPALAFNDARRERVRPQIAEFALAAERYAAAHSAPEWLNGVSDDATFLTKLMEAVQADAGAVPTAAAVQSLNIGNDLKDWFSNAATAVRGAVARVQSSVARVQSAATAAVGAAAGAVTSAATAGARDAYLALFTSYRPAASTLLGRFFGDVFSYLENRQPILDRVLPAFDAAVAARRAGDEELYLVGHSFGGIILYEILTKHRPEVVCDLYVTVGSQVALFAEIDRIEEKQPIRDAFATGPDAVAQRPAAAKRWINILDETDLFGFGITDVFGGAWECKFDTQAMPIYSHGAYFDTPRFYARLRERVGQAFRLGTDVPVPKADG